MCPYEVPLMFLLLIPVLRIFRHEDPSISVVQFLTSHFFTYLKNQGVEGVKTWTKGFDVFNKRYIILPVCMDGHWSLCALVNPGSILNATEMKESKTNHQVCSLFFILYF